MKPLRTLPALALLVLAACHDSDDSPEGITPPNLGPGEVDLSVTKAADRTKAAQGDTVVYTITVANDPSGANATSVRVTDQLPAGVTYVDDTPSQGSYAPATGIWTLGGLTAGSMATLDIEVTVTAAPTTVLTNVANDLSADQNDPFPPNDAASADVLVVQEVDLAVTKTVDDPAPSEGDTVTFTITLTHASGSVPATGVSLVDLLPAGLTHAGNQPSQGAYDPTSGLWSVGTIPVGASVTLDLDAVVDAGTGGQTLTNTTSGLTLDQVDPAAGNDSDSADVVVMNVADVQVTKTVDNPQPSEGETVVYTVTARNLGPALATGVRVDDLLPPGVLYGTHDVTDGTYDETTGAWTIPTLAVGAANEATLEIFALVAPGTAGQTIDNTATLAALDQTDPNAANDSATASLMPIPSTNLALDLAADDETPVRYQPVALDLEVANDGSLQATGVLVQVSLAAGLTLEKATAGVGSFDSTSRVWDVGTLNGGQAATLALVASVDPGNPGGAALTAQAAVSGLDQVDPDPSNDTASALLTVATDSVDIVRDAYGTPHVFAGTDHGALYGAGYASAELRLSQMLRTRLIFRGEMAQYFGRGTVDEPDAYLQSDRMVRYIGLDRLTKRVIQSIDPGTRSLLRAYAAGVNAYMSKPGVALHPTLAAAGVPFKSDPWLASDCIGAWLQLGSKFGPNGLPEAKALSNFEDKVTSVYGGDVDAALAGEAREAVYDDSAAVVAQSDVPPALQQAMADYAAMKGMTGPTPAPVSLTPPFSHAYAVSGARTADGHAIVIADPRYPIDRPSNLMEIHVVGETFDVRGIATPGSLNVLVGSTRNVAWGASSLGHDQTDLFRIEVNAAGTQYELDGAFRPFELLENETILVKGESSQSITYRECFFGPVVTPLITGVPPDPSKGFAMRTVPGFAPTEDAAVGFFAMYRAADVDAFGAALADWDYPTGNVVFGDTSGRIGYWANGAVPARSPDQPYYELGGDVAQLGRTTDDDWMELIPHELLPHVTDPASGVLFTANHMPVGSWYPIRLGLATGSTGDTSRSRRLRELFAAFGPTYDRAELEAWHTDEVPTAQRDLVRLAIEAHDNFTAFTGDGEEALAVARQWYGVSPTMDLSHPGVLIAARLDVTLREAQGPPGSTAAAMMVAAWGGGLAGTHNFLKARVAELAGGGTPSFTGYELQWLEDRLAETWPAVETLLGSPPPPPGSAWLDAYEQLALTLTVPAFRGVDGLPALDENDVVTVLMECENKHTLTSQSGQAYTLVMPLGDLDASTSVLAFGDGEPGSPFDQSELTLWTSQSFKPSPVSRAAITAQLGPTVESTLSY